MMSLASTARNATMLKRDESQISEALKPEIFTAGDDDTFATCSVHTDDISQTSSRNHEPEIRDVGEFFRYSRVLKPCRDMTRGVSDESDDTTLGSDSGRTRKVRFAEHIKTVNVITPVPTRHHENYYMQYYDLRRIIEEANWMIYLTHSEESRIGRFLPSGYDTLRGLEDMVEENAIERRRSTVVHTRNVLDAYSCDGDGEMTRFASLQKSAYHQKVAIERALLDAQECERIWEEAPAKEKSSKKKGLRGLLAKMKGKN
jgi:hypothetical protein